MDEGMMNPAMMDAEAREAEKKRIDDLRFVAQCADRARKHGMEVEWFETFIAEVQAGVTPRAAAVGACREWDIG